MLVEDSELHACPLRGPWPRHASGVYCRVYTDGKDPAHGRSCPSPAPSRSNAARCSFEPRRRAFARTGFAHTSMEEIAAAAGVTRLIIYRHFDSQGVALPGGAARCLRCIRRSLAARGPNAGGYGVGARALLAIARADEAGFRLLWRHACREPRFARYADELRRRAVATVGTALADRVPRRSPRVGCARGRRLSRRGRAQLARVRRSGPRRAVREGDEPGDASGGARLGPPRSRYRQRTVTRTPSVITSVG